VVLFSPLGQGPAAFLIPAAVAVYGLATLVAGFGVYARRRWGRRLALTTIAIGLLELVWQTTLIGPDLVTLFGVGLWSLVLLLLLATGGRRDVA
jgi:uncharacterized membrane protein (DUF2068 family)